MSHEEKLSALERAVDELEKKVAQTLDADEDWDNGTEVDDEDTDNNSDDDDEEDDDGVEKRHRFETLTDFVANRDNVNQTTAAARARREFPAQYRSFQRTGETDVGKGYRALVNDETRKGCSEVVAKQRVSYAHPNLARDDITKAADSGSVYEFMHKVDVEMQQTRCSRSSTRVYTRAFPKREVSAGVRRTATLST